MSDPKYTPTAKGIMHQDGYMLPADEPLMLLRGKDIGALSAIVDYVDMLADQPPSETIRSHLLSSLERLGAFYKYQVNNPQLQSVGCSQRAHVDVKHILDAAKDRLIMFGWEEAVAG